MITKELLSEVIGKDIDWCSKHPSVDTVEFRAHNTNDICEHINIYELAHKCKEWANITKGVYLSSGYDEMDKKWEGMMMKYTFVADTEPEAIFKACQWILENK